MAKQKSSPKNKLNRIRTQEIPSLKKHLFSQPSFFLLFLFLAVNFGKQEFGSPSLRCAISCHLYLAGNIGMVSFLLPIGSMYMIHLPTSFW